MSDQVNVDDDLAHSEGDTSDTAVSRLQADLAEAREGARALNEHRVELEGLLREAARELDRAGAPPAQSLADRVRQLARKYAGDLQSARAAAEAGAQAAWDKRVLLERKRLPDQRPGETKKITLKGEEVVCPKCKYVLDDGLVRGYATVNFYEDGRPGELFLKLSKQGSMASGLADVFATAVSMLLQYGVPFEVLYEKFRATRFLPDGPTGERGDPADGAIPFVTSSVDYVVRWVNRILPMAKEIYGQKEGKAEVEAAERPVAVPGKVV